MNFNFTDEQQFLADNVRRFVREMYTFKARRDILGSSEGGAAAHGEDSHNSA